MKKSNKKGESKEVESKEVETLEVTDWEVLNTRETKKGFVFFNLKLNGITIYGCKVIESDKGDFISFPSYKGTDGNYYSHVYARLDDMTTNEIIAEIEKQLNK